MIVVTNESAYFTNVTLSMRQNNFYILVKRYLFSSEVLGKSRCLTNLYLQFQEMLDVSKKDQLMKLVTQIVPSQMRHHAEAEACDLLMEVERLDILTQFVDQVGFGTLNCRLNCYGKDFVYLAKVKQYLVLKVKIFYL